MKMHFAIAVFSLALGLGIGFGINQPAPTIVKPVAVAPAPTVVNKVSPANPATLEALWTIGGPQYQDQVRRLAAAYGVTMDADCRAPDFDVAAAVESYQGFVAEGDKPSLVAAVRTQVAALACIGGHGVNYAYSVL